MKRLIVFYGFGRVAEKISYSVTGYDLVAITNKKLEHEKITIIDKKEQHNFSVNNNYDQVLFLYSPPGLSDGLISYFKNIRILRDDLNYIRLLREKIQNGFYYYFGSISEYSAINWRVYTRSKKKISILISEARIFDGSLRLPPVIEENKVEYFCNKYSYLFNKYFYKGDLEIPFLDCASFQGLIDGLVVNGPFFVNRNIVPVSSFYKYQFDDNPVKLSLLKSIPLPLVVLFVFSFFIKSNDFNRAITMCIQKKYDLFDHYKLSEYLVSDGMPFLPGVKLYERRCD